MNRPFITSVLALATLATSGCVGTFQSAATSRSASSSAALSMRPRAFALEVIVEGGASPTPSQLAGIESRFVQELATQGWVLVTDPALADHIIKVKFFPNPNDPENSGRISLIDVKRNPRTSVP